MESLRYPTVVVCLVEVLLLHCVHHVFCKPLSVCPKLSKNEQAVMERKLADEGQGLHWSFYLIPQLRQFSEENLEQFDQGTVDTKSVYLFGKSGKRCPKLSTNNPFINLHDDCPVHYVMQHDPNRVPSNVVHARCNCKKCLGRASSGTACTPVYTYTKVFRRTADCGFELVLEHIPVACTCSSVDKVVVV